MGEEVEEREEQVGGSEMQKEESGPDGDVAGRGEHVGEQEEGAAGADPAAAGGEDTARVHPRGSQVGLQQSFLGECPRCETNHNNGASSAGESRTRDPPEHSAPPHPRRGNGGGATGDGDDDSETRASSSSSPKTKTPLKPPRRQRLKQPQQSQHSNRDPDQRHEPARLQRPDGRKNGSDTDEHFDPNHGEHDDPVQLLGLPPDPHGVDALLREPAKDELGSGSGNARAWESQFGSSSGLPVRSSYGAS